MPKSVITNSTPDSELFGKMVEQQKEALSVLYDRYADRLYGLAFKILHNEGLAEDVLQELFIYIWENAAKFETKRGSVGAWLTVLCRNRCIDKLRSRASAQKYTTTIEDTVLLNLGDSESENPFENVSYKETQQKVKAALQQLPAEQREPIMLAYFEGLSQTEIADKIKQPLGTVKTRIRLGMQKLRDILNLEYQP